MIQVEKPEWRYECLFCRIQSETFATREIRDREARRHILSCASHPVTRLTKDLEDAKADVEFWRTAYFGERAAAQFSLAAPQEWVKTDEKIVTDTPK